MDGAVLASRSTEPAAAKARPTAAATGHRHPPADQRTAVRFGSARLLFNKEVCNNAVPNNRRATRNRAALAAVGAVRAAAENPVAEADTTARKQHRILDFFPQARTRTSQRVRALFFGVDSILDIISVIGSDACSCP